MKKLIVVLITSMLLTGCTLFNTPKYTEQEYTDLTLREVDEEIGRVTYQLSLVIYLKLNSPEILEQIDWDEVDRLYVNEDYRKEKFEELALDR